MSWRGRWVVLVPGEAAWVEDRTRELLEEIDDASLDAFTVIPGQGRYHAVVETGNKQREPEVLLGDAFSFDTDEAVYAIEGRDEFPEVLKFVKGNEIELNQDPEELVRSLGCKLPWFDELPPPPFKPQMRTVALIQGVSVAKIRKMMERLVGGPLPTDYHRFEETPQGVLISDGTGPLGSAHIWLTERLPRATVYSVTATPTLDSFVVAIMCGTQISEFVHPPGALAYFPLVHEVMGEKTPERILAAMGIPKEWFQL